MSFPAYIKICKISRTWVNVFLLFLQTYYSNINADINANATNATTNNQDNNYNNNIFTVCVMRMIVTYILK